MISDKLKKLQQENKPQTLDTMFQDSKEGMLLDKVKNAVNVILPQMVENMVKGMETRLTEAIRGQIGAIRTRDGVDGRSPDPKEIARQVVLLIPKPKDGKDGKDSKIDKNEIINEVLQKIPRARKGGGGGGGDTIISDDLSSQVNGVATTFTTTKKVGKPIMVISSQFPTVLRLTTDFTASGTTLTLDAAVPVIAAGQTLIFVYAEG